MTKYCIIILHKDRSYRSISVEDEDLSVDKIHRKYIKSGILKKEIQIGTKDHSIFIDKSIIFGLEIKKVE